MGEISQNKDIPDIHDFRCWGQQQMNEVNTNLMQFECKLPTSLLSTLYEPARNSSPRIGSALTKSKAFMLIFLAGLMRVLPFNISALIDLTKKKQTIRSIKILFATIPVMIHVLTEGVSCSFHRHNLFVVFFYQDAALV